MLTLPSLRRWPQPIPSWRSLHYLTGAPEAALDRAGVIKLHHRLSSPPALIAADLPQVA